MNNLKNNDLKILLVEDDEDDQFILKKIFKNYLPGAEIAQAFNGNECINYLQENASALPHLITMDLNMPFINGIEAAKILKNDERFKQINVVILSTSNSKTDIKSATESGANDYFIKPIEYEALKDTIKNIIEKWL